MPFPLSLARHLKSQVTVEAPGTVDSYGKATGYGSPQLVMGRIQPSVERVTHHEGREAVSHTTVILQDVALDGSPVSIGPYHRITLPAGYTPQQPPIIRFDRKNHDLGTYGWVVKL